MNFQKRTRLFLPVLLPFLGGCQDDSVTDDSTSCQSINTTYASYAWITHQADGTLDTVFSSSDNLFPGDTAIEFTYTLGATNSSEVSTNAACSTVSLPDTFWLSDTAITPEVHILDKDTLFAYLDTLADGSEFVTLDLNLQHFQGDSAQLSWEGPSWTELDAGFKFCTQNQYQPCSIDNNSSLSSCGSLQISYTSETKVRPKLWMAPTSLVDEGIYSWTLRIQNRYGYRDSVTGIIHVLPNHCTESPIAISECGNYTVSLHQSKMYTWIEPYADGHQDTLWSTDSSGYYGTQTIRYADTLKADDPFEITTSTGASSEDAASSESCTQAIALASVWLCPGDTVTLDSSGILHYTAPSADTLWFNWGDSARDSLVEPRVHIVNADSILVKLDTATFFIYAGLTVNATHYPMDSATFILEGDTNFASLGNTIDNYCMAYTAPCSEGGDPIIIDCAVASYPVGTVYYPVVRIRQQNATDTSGTLSWKLSIQNRFGYRDSVVGSTLLLPYPCK